MAITRGINAMNPGCYADIALAEYHSAPGWSKSDLDLITRSPAHWKYGERNETPAMRLGSAIHAAVLEPDRWNSRYLRIEGRRKAGKDIDPNFVQVTADEWDTCMRIRDAIGYHPTCQDLMSYGAAEQSAWWHDPETGLLCKCRPDWNRPGMLIDLKTTTDASPAGFARAIERYRYHVQAAYALDGWKDANAMTGTPVIRNIKSWRFIFIAVEKTPPYAIGLYELSAATLDAARALYQRDLAIIKNCLDRQHWPGYDLEVVMLPAPQQIIGVGLDAGQDAGPDAEQVISLLF